RPISETLCSAHDILIEQNRLKSNYTAWLLAAIGQLAFALDDADLVERVTNDKTGFPAHIDAAILPDGMEHEATPYYHNFVALAYGILAETCASNGIDLYTISGTGKQTIDSLWDAFARIAYADGTIPDANDGSYWVDSIYDSEICDVYEIAYARTGKPLYGWLAQQAYQRRDINRDRWTTLLYAQSDLPDAGEAALETVTILPDSGMIVARPSEELQAYIPYGAYAGAHSHYDRMALNIHPFSRDAGTTLYGIEERRTWYQQTLAHNTVVVDGNSQAEGDAQPVAHSESGIRLRSESLYPGVNADRRVQWSQHRIEDTFALQSDSQHQYDWIFHSDAPWQIADATPAPLSGTYSEDAPGCHLHFESTIENISSIILTTQFESITYQLRLEASQPIQLTLGNCPGRSYDPVSRRYVLIARAQTKNIEYHAIIERLT
ncbi:MAG: heparinase II/III domain-containing protein, partial [Aggregatilineales bacterium]